MFTISETGKFGVRRRDCPTLDAHIFDIPGDAFKVEVYYMRSRHYTINLCVVCDDNAANHIFIPCEACSAKFGPFITN